MNRETKIPAAFFDLDWCVIAGSSTYHFGKAALQWGAYSRKDLLKAAVRTTQRGRKSPDGDAVRDHLLAALAGCTAEQMDVLVPHVLSPILAELREEMYLRILEHEADGVPTYLCSASPVEIVEVVADVLNCSGGVLATAVATDADGRLTGRLEGPFCYGEGVVEAVEQEAKKADLDLEASWAYGNSAADLPLLEAVGKPVAVNPDRTMRARAQASGWQIMCTEDDRHPARNAAIAAGVATGATAVAVAAILWATRRTK